MNVKLIKQFRPPSTTATSILQGPYLVKFLSVCNTSAASAKVSLYLSVGTVNPAWNESTAVQWEVPVPRGEMVLLEFPEPILLTDTLSRMAVKTDVANALTVNVFGERA